jgi:hypothetical protein
MMIQRLALVVAIAVFAVSRQAAGDETVADPFRLQTPKGVEWPLKEADAEKVNIPQDLDGCFAQLEKMLSKGERQRMKSGPEGQIDQYYYVFSEGDFEVVRQIGQWLGDLWRLDGKSRLAEWFNARGIDDGDDMADIIIHSYWRHLNAKPIDLDGQIKAHQVYIPKDLDDCFAELEKRLSKRTVAKMKGGSEEDMVKYHHGLGTWMRNKWGLWKGSRLSKWFNDKGIRHPDDMSGIILDSFWRHLNEKPIKLDEQIKHYQDYWKKRSNRGPSASDVKR